MATAELVIDRNIKTSDMKESAENACQMIKSIGSPFRLMILCALTEGEMTVGQLQNAIDARQSLTSQHLSRLRSDGLVKARRADQRVFYSLADPVASEIVAILYKHFCSPK
jgi:ArsR family transcriptional regulator, virulence genes transcriptional regulator